MLYETLPTESDLSWPLYGMQPRIIRLRRNVTELEQRLTSLEQSVKEEDLVQLAIGLSLKQDNGKPLNKSPKKGSPEGVRGKNGITKITKQNGIRQASPKITDSSPVAMQKENESGQQRSGKNKNKKSSKERQSNKPEKGETDASDNTSACAEKRAKNEILNYALEHMGAEIEKDENDNCKPPSKKTPKQKNAKKGNKREVPDGNKNRRGRAKQKKVVESYFIDCSQPATDDILKPVELKSYLLERMKVDGKVKNFGDKVKIELDGHTIVITVTDFSFSKRYLKYLTKRFLKKQNLRDWLRVVSPGSSKSSYEIKYFKFNNDGSDESSDED